MAQQQPDWQKIMLGVSAFLHGFAHIVEGAAPLVAEVAATVPGGSPVAGLAGIVGAAAEVLDTAIPNPASTAPQVPISPNSAG